MSDIDLLDLTVSRAGRLIHAGELSPVEITEAYLERIEQLDPKIGAYVTLTAERARADARRAAEELAAGHDRGPLHGIPIALKDVYDTAGIRTTGGAKFMADRVPGEDSTVARKLREAGAVLLGKLNMHELGFGVTTVNPHFGTTHNPWDLARVPGGSSGGSAAAIAASLAAGTMGSDTGGSIRMPAALCGVVGLKPTYGRVSRAGVLPMAWSLDHAGPITRTVEDAALLLTAVAGDDPDDYSTVPMPVEDYAAGLGAGLRGLRVGVARAFFFDRLDDEVRSGVEQALEVLRGLGATLHEVDLGWDSAPANARLAWFRITLAEAQHIHRDTFRSHPEDFGTGTAAVLALEPPTGAELAEAYRVQCQVMETQRRTLAAVDVVITPTAPVLATPIGETKVTYGGSEDGLSLAFTRLMVPFNVSHLPALSVPCGFSQTNLPIGLQIVGRPFDEATVLRVGHQYEQATDWHLKRPVL